MTKQSIASIIHHFSSIEDPRRDRLKKHQLSDIFFITLCATICGADNWVAVERFGKAKEQWFTEQFSKCVSNWVADLSHLVEEDIIALDGKCLRRSIDRTSNKAAIYIVSAWSRQNSLVLGQVKVDDKSNEITAIPKRLTRLDIAGVVITIDAMGCQKKIAEQIAQQKGDYVLSLKAD